MALTYCNCYFIQSIPIQKKKRLAATLLERPEYAACCEKSYPFSMRYKIPQAFCRKKWYSGLAAFCGKAYTAEVHEDAAHTQGRIGGQQSHMNKIWKNMAINTLRVVSSLLFPLISFPYISHLLGPERLGTVDFAASVTNYFTLIAGLEFPPME